MKGKTLGAMVKLATAFRAPLEPDAPLSSVVQHVLKCLARRWRALNDEILELDAAVASYVTAIAPELLSRPGVGIEVASTLMVTAGDNPERMATEASFAALCGFSPVDASSGRQQRHRLNRSGNRDANRALWVIAFTRMRCDKRTKAYVEKRSQQGLSRTEILRCLKRYIAREVFALIRASVAASRLQLDT